MPQAMAPSAPCVQVWLSPQTTVLPGSDDAHLRPDHVHDALAGLAEVEQPDAMTRGLLAQQLQIAAAELGRLRSAAGLARNGMIRRGEHHLGIAHLPSDLPKLLQAAPAAEVVHDMAVDGSSAMPLPRSATTCASQILSNSVCAAMVSSV